MKVCEVCGSDFKVYKNKVTNKFLCNKHKMQIYKYGEILERTKFDKNEIIMSKDFAEILLYDNDNKVKAKTLIDLDDIQLASKYKWHLNEVNGYVESIFKSKNIKLHRLIMSPNEFEQIDHINGDKLDNRKINLRKVNNTQNSINSKVYSNNKSGHRGIYWSNSRKNWVAQITVNGKKIRLGGFSDINDAIFVRKQAEEKYFGEYAPYKRKDE